MNEIEVTARNVKGW